MRSGDGDRLLVVGENESAGRSWFEVGAGYDAGALVGNPVDLPDSLQVPHHGGEFGALCRAQIGKYRRVEGDQRDVGRRFGDQRR